MGIKEEFEEMKERFNKVEEDLKKITESLNIEIELPIEYLDKEMGGLEYVREGDAGFDLRAAGDYILYPGMSQIIGTGIKAAVPEGYELQIRARSGISAKTWLRVANGTGTIDSGFRGEIGVILQNTYHGRDFEYDYLEDIKGEKQTNGITYPKKSYFIAKGDRIAQAVLSRVCKARFKSVPNVSELGNDRGGGFGSSGIN